MQKIRTNRRSVGAAQMIAAVAVLAWSGTSASAQEAVPSPMGPTLCAAVETAVRNDRNLQVSPTPLNTSYSLIRFPEPARS